MQNPSDKSERLVYEIVDTDNPQNNVVVDPADAVVIDPFANEKRELTSEEREELVQRAAHIARIKLAEEINARRDGENRRALKARVTKRRKKEKLAKASRKRNR